MNSLIREILVLFFCLIFLQMVKEDLGRLKHDVESWEEASGRLIDVCGGPASVKVAKQKHDLEALLEETEEELAKQQMEADMKTSRTENYDSLFQVLLHKIFLQ